MSQEKLQCLQAQLEQKAADLQRCEAQLEKSKAHSAKLRESLLQYKERAATTLNLVQQLKAKTQEAEEAKKVAEQLRTQLVAATVPRSDGRHPASPQAGRLEVGLGALSAEVDRLKLDAAGMRAAAQQREEGAAQRLAEVQGQVLALERRQQAQVQAQRRQTRRDKKQVQAQLSRYGAAFASFMSTLGQAHQELLGGPQPGGGAGSGQASDRSWSGGDGEENSSGMQLVARGSWDSRLHAADEHGDGEALQLQPHPPDRPRPVIAQGDAIPSLPQAADVVDETVSAAKRTRLQRDGSNGREGSNALDSLMSNPGHLRECPPLQRQPGAVGDCPPRTGLGGTSAGSGTALTMAWKVESRAVSIVENWLGEVTAAAGPRAAHAAMQGAVFGLHEAMLQKQCPLHVSCVVAGFETALLQCAGPRGLDCGDVLSGQVGSGASAAGAAAAVEEVPFTAVWCRQEVLHSRAFSGLLLCAQQLDAKLARHRGTALQKQQPQQPGLLEQLQARLHMSAAQPLLLNGQAGVDPQACSLAAAAATLYRMQGNEQAMRVLLYDIVVAEAELSARTLPRIAAAVLAWPQALSRPDAEGDVVRRALLAALQDVRQRVLEDQARTADDTATAAGSVSGTTSTADRLPGILAAATALEAVLASASSTLASPGVGKRTGWPASRTAFKEALAAAGKAKSNWSGGRDEDRQRCVRAALEVARTCLGPEWFCRQAAEAGAVDVLDHTVAQMKQGVPRGIQALERAR